MCCRNDYWNSGAYCKKGSQGESCLKKDSDYPFFRNSSIYLPVFSAISDWSIVLFASIKIFTLVMWLRHLIQEALFGACVFLLLSKIV